MGTVNKVLAFVFVLIVLSSLLGLTVKPVDAQAVSKPSVPQFTVQLADYSYDVPPTTTTSTNPYTGEKTTTNTPGYRVENKTIEVTITNQPFTPYTNKDGYECNLYYQIEYKGHFSDEWQHCYSNLEQSNSQYTTLQWWPYYPFAAGYQVDFRVEAKVGYIVMKPVTPDTFYPLYPMFTAESSSGWSNVQMFIMPDGSSTQPPSQTATQPTNPPTISGNNQPQLPNQTQPPSCIFNPFFLLGIIALLLCIIIGLVILFLIKRAKVSTRIDNNLSQINNSSRVLENDVCNYVKHSKFRLKFLWVQ